MKVFETSKTTGLFSKKYELSIVHSIESPEAITPDVEKIKAALVEWAQRRGSDCRKLGLILIASESLHEAVLQHTRGALVNDRFLHAFISTVSAELVLFDRKGNQRHRVSLVGSPAGNPLTPDSKPSPGS